MARPFGGQRNATQDRRKTRAREYRVNPDLLRAASFRGPTTLKGIEPHRLRHLILEDLQVHGPDANHPVAPKDLHARIGLEIGRQKLRRALEDLIAQDLVVSTGKRGQGSGYSLRQKSG